MSIIKNAIVALVDGVRSFASPEFRKNLTDYGDYMITEAYVGRQPVDKNILRVVNMITLGTFDKQKEKLKYDKVYHLYLLMRVVKVSAAPQAGLPDRSGHSPALQTHGNRDETQNRGASRGVPSERSEDEAILKCHKEETTMLEVMSGKSFEQLKHPDGDGFKITNINIPLVTFIHNAEKRLSTEKFFEYNAITLNCQHHILNLLESNGIKSAENRKFIIQDALSLIKHNPVVNFVLKQFTNLGALFHRIKHGTGVDDDTSDLFV